MRHAIALVLSVTAAIAPALASACDYYALDVVPGLRLTYNPKGGRAYFNNDPPYAADTFRLSFYGQSGDLPEHFSLSIEWPEAPSAAASFALPVRWWDVLVIGKPPVGSSLRVLADGLEIDRKPNWFTADRITLMQGADRIRLVQPAPDFRQFRTLTVSIDGPDGTVFASRTYKLPAWKKLAKAFARTQDLLVRGRDQGDTPGCRYWPIPFD